MNILPGEYFKRYEMKFDITVNDPLLEPFLPVIRRRHERSVLKELEFTNRKKDLPTFLIIIFILVCTGFLEKVGYSGNGLLMLRRFI